MKYIKDSYDMAINTSFVFLLAAVLAFGCQRSEIQMIDTQSFQISARALDFEVLGAENAFGSSALSKATESVFQVGDRIGVYVTQGASSVVSATNHSSNVPYRYNGFWRAAGALSGELVSTTVYRSTAYYPYQQGFSDATAIEHEVALDQSSVVGASAGALELSDFLVSTPPTLISGVDATPQDLRTSLSFTHAMAKLVVTLTVPGEVDGGMVLSLTEVRFKGVRQNCVVNLATGVVSAPLSAIRGDIVPRLTSTSGVAKGATVFYEAIVPPQVFAAGSSLVWLKFATDRGPKELTCVLPPSGAISLGSNQKHTLMLSSIADLTFVTELPGEFLLDGLAHTDLELKIKSKTAWKLTSPNGGWLKLKVGSDAYGYMVSGSGSEADQTVYVELDPNASAIEARAVVLLLESTTDSKARATYLVNQNYFNYEHTPVDWAVGSGNETQAMSLINGNQLVRVTSDTDWLRFSSSAVFGLGNPKTSVDVVGFVDANSLYLQVPANNTNAVRSATVRYTPVNVAGNLLPTSTKSQSVTQAAASVALSRTSVEYRTTEAQASVSLFTVTAPVGVKWRLSALSAVSGTVSDFVLLPSSEQTGTGSAQPVSFSCNEEATGTARKASVDVLYGTSLASTVEIIHGASISIAPATDWAKVSSLGGSREVTVTVGGASTWTASVSDLTNAGLKVSPTSGASGSKATITWAAQEPKVSPGNLARSGKVIFSSNPTGLSVAITTDQLAGATLNPPAASEYVKIGSLYWATGNLVAKNDIECMVGASDDAGLHFQFGSLIGYKSGAVINGGTGVGSNPSLLHLMYWNGIGEYSWANDGMVRPAVLSGTPSAWPQETSGSAHQWFFSGKGATPDKIDVTDATKGVGDACTYYLGNKWRLPKKEEYKTLCNGAANGATWEAAGGSWMQVGGVFSTTRLFFPVSGIRSSESGRFSLHSGYGWSSSVGDATHGYVFSFNFEAVNPEKSDARSSGFPVRCVSDAP